MDARVSMCTHKVLKNCLCAIRKRCMEPRVLPEVGMVLMSMHARISVAETVFQGWSRLRACSRFLRPARRLTHPDKNVNGIPNVFQCGHSHARRDYRRCKTFAVSGRVVCARRAGNVLLHFVIAQTAARLLEGVLLANMRPVREKRMRLGKPRWIAESRLSHELFSTRSELASSARNGRGTLSERVYQAFKQDIVRGFHKAGEALGEKELAQRYKGSRTPVREAALRLQQENLLRVVPNRGYFVSSMTLEWLNQIYEFRAAVEGACAELAAHKGNDPKLLEELTRLAQAEYETKNRASYEKFIKADTALHIGIARLTRNPMLVRAVSDMRCHMERIMYAAIDIGYYGEAPVQEHAEIIRAIRHQDDERARRLMYEHIIQSRRKVLRLASGDNQLA